MSLVIPNLNNTNNKTIKQLFNLNYQFMNSKLKIIVTLLSIGLGNFVTAQTLNGKYTTKIKNNLQSNFQSAKSLLEDNTDYSGKTILLLTPSFPISFNRIEKDSLNNWRIGPQAAIGGAYYFMVGKGYRNANETIQIEPYVVLGIGIDGGVSQNLEAPGVIGNLNLNCMIGFYKYFNFLFAYDLLNKKSVYGIGARVDLFALTQGAGTIILNKEKFFKD